MTLGIFLIIWSLWYAFKSGFCISEENKIPSTYWGIASIICATFGILVLGEII